MPHLQQGAKVIGKKLYKQEPMLSKMFLMGITLKQQSTTAIDADTQVGPVNLFLHSLFSQVDVSLNKRLISPSTITYPYRVMIETLLNYGEEAKTSQLSMDMFYKDTLEKWMLPTLWLQTMP